MGLLFYLEIHSARLTFLEVFLLLVVVGLQMSVWLFLLEFLRRKSCHLQEEAVWFLPFPDKVVAVMN